MGGDWGAVEIATARLGTDDCALGVTSPLAWSLLLTGVGLGITHGETIVNPNFDLRVHSDLGRAVNLGLAMLVVLQLASGALALGFEQTRGTRPAPLG